MFEMIFIIFVVFAVSLLCCMLLFRWLDWIKTKKIVKNRYLSAIIFIYVYYLAFLVVEAILKFILPFLDMAEIVRYLPFVGSIPFIMLGPGLFLGFILFLFMVPESIAGWNIPTLYFTLEMIGISLAFSIPIALIYNLKLRNQRIARYVKYILSTLIWSVADLLAIYSASMLS